MCDVFNRYFNDLTWHETIIVGFFFLGEGDVNVRLRVVLFQQTQHFVWSYFFNNKTCSHNPNAVRFGCQFVFMCDSHITAQHVPHNAINTHILYQVALISITHSLLLPSLTRSYQHQRVALISINESLLLAYRLALTDTRAC